MPLKVLPPLIENYVLAKSDAKYNNEGAPSMIKVRQATRGDEEDRNRLLALVEKNYKVDGSVSFLSDVSFDDVEREEVFLTLADCNLVDKDDKPLFQFKDNRINMTKKAFTDAWCSLNYDIAAEISLCVKKFNVQWGASGNA
jgi:hypothetical protein